jgi:hypothetical protein
VLGDECGHLVGQRACDTDRAFIGLEDLTDAELQVLAGVADEEAQRARH